MPKNSYKIITNSHFIIIVVAWMLFGCATTKQNQKVPSEELFKVGDLSVGADEFIYVYQKNSINNDSAITAERVKNYFDLFVNFKLKVKQAYDSGLHKEEDFIREFEGYRKQLAKPYLTEPEVTEKLAKQAYERMKEEVNAAHILLRIDPDAAPEDTLQVFNEITKIRKEAQGEPDFEKLAKKYSQDPSAQNNGGNLGYFSALQMVYEFEDAAYNTAVDSISKPVRTRFGYHILKVYDRRPNQGKIEVSHIMVRATDGISAEDSAKAQNKIQTIYDQLNNGGNWDDLCKQHSDDRQSASKGGKLPWFGTGEMPAAFESAAFELKEVGSISRPVKSAYGWHIIRLDGKKTLEPYEELEGNLKSKVSKDSRSRINKQILLERLRKENKIVENKEVINSASSRVDSTLLMGKWKYTKKEGDDQQLFSINDKSYSLADFLAYAEKSQFKREGISAAQFLKSLYNKYFEQSVMEYEENHLEDKYYDYKMLVNEYKEGILLFKLMDEKVWSKGVSDTLGLQQFYKDHADDYQWLERYNGNLYQSEDMAVITEIKGLIAAGDTTKLKNFIKEKQSKDPLSVNVEAQTIEKGSEPWNLTSASVGGVYQLDVEGLHLLFHVKETLPPGQKKLNEIKGVVISDYQTKLEQDWIASLKKMYPVQVNQEVYDKAYNYLEKNDRK